MCPDKIMISAYFDNELPEAETAQIAEHLISCPHCAEIYNSFKAQSGKMKDFGEAYSGLVIENGLDKRILDRIIHDKHGSHPVFWDRRVSLPLPVAAAAAAVFIFMGIFSFNIANNNRFNSHSPVLSEKEPSAVPSLEDSAEDMVLFLQDKDSFATVEMDIPLDMKSVNHGEAQLVRVDNNNGGY